VTDDGVERVRADDAFSAQAGWGRDGAGKGTATLA
jgi:hypothetical protein